MKSIPGYSNYKVASNGEIWVFINGKSLHTLTPQKNNWGYLRIRLSSDLGKWRFILVHRLVAEAYLPNIDMLPEVNHKDGDKLNNDVSNLEWCTSSQNRIHQHALKKKALDIGAMV